MNFPILNTVKKKPREKVEQITEINQFGNYSCLDKLIFFMFPVNAKLQRYIFVGFMVTPESLTSP